jgi:hypothetical protein
VVALESLLRRLAEELSEAPAPLGELESRRGVRRRRRQFWWAVSSVAAAAVVAVLALVVDPSGGDVRVTHSAGTTVTSNWTQDATPSPSPPGSRLQQPYVTVSYQPGLAALGSFRVDPAPDVVRPRLTEAQALAAFEASDAGSRPGGEEIVTVARFGLFSGNPPNAPAPDGTLTGLHPVEREPAWLIVLDGVTLRSGGAARNPDAPSTSIPEVPRVGHAVVVISDATGEAVLPGISIASGPSGVR